MASLNPDRPPAAGVARIYRGGSIILEDRVLPDGAVRTVGGRIAAVGGASGAVPEPGDEVIDLGGGYLAPGFVDLHVHGGEGSDFMDGTPEAFRAVCRAHAKRGTTALLPTSTVAGHEEILRFLELCRRFLREETGGAAVLGAHFYGPYFAPEARGCHPSGGLRPPEEGEFGAYLEFADTIARATIAPELPGAEAFARACRMLGVGVNIGHSHATFDQVAEAIGWGAGHVDHLFCAMSDRARLRRSQTYPMRGGVMEATLFFDELTTEVIADGKHLAPELLRLALKAKGPDRLALVTDANRALGMPDGEYWFGPEGTGERIRRADGVGLTADGSALASGVEGLDLAIRTLVQGAGVPLAVAVRMASLTPARIAGRDRDLGSIAVGKRADLVVLDRDLNVARTDLAGGPS